MKQIIIIRKDLKMRRGKEIAQGAHASGKFMMEGGLHSDEAEEWARTGTKKVCVRVDSEQELLDLYQKGLAAGLFSHIIRDSGLTEFNGVPTLTACAIGPAKDEDIDPITGHLSLY